MVAAAAVATDGTIAERQQWHADHKSGKTQGAGRK